MIRNPSSIGPLMEPGSRTRVVLLPGLLRRYGVAIEVGQLLSWEASPRPDTLITLAHTAAEAGLALATDSEITALHPRGRHRPVYELSRLLPFYGVGSAVPGSSTLVGQSLSCSVSPSTDAFSPFTHTAACASPGSLERAARHRRRKQSGTCSTPLLAAGRTPSRAGLGASRAGRFGPP